MQTGRQFANRVGVVAALCALALGLAAQSPAKRPSFEVASVKANLTDSARIDEAPVRSGDRVRMHNAFLSSIVVWAYHLNNPNYQLVAGPWDNVLGDNYDIDAVAAGGTSEDDLRAMFRSLLEDRCHLQVHRETRELAAYDLVTAKGGAKLTAAPLRPQKVTMGRGGSSSWAEFVEKGKVLAGVGASMEELSVVLTRQMNAPVRDRTGLTGTYDFRVPFSTGVDGSEAPVLTTAIHELGLNLEKSRSSFDVLVIDHVEKPSQN